MPPRTRPIGTRPATSIRRLPSRVVNHAGDAMPLSEYVVVDDKVLAEGTFESKESEPLVDLINSKFTTLSQRIDKLAEKLGAAPALAPSPTPAPSSSVSAANIDALSERVDQLAERFNGTAQVPAPVTIDKEMIREIVREVVTEMKDELRGRPGLQGPQGKQGPMNAKVIPAVLNHVGLENIKYNGTGKYAYQTIDGITGDFSLPIPKPEGAEQDENEEGDDGDGSRPGSPVTVFITPKK